MSQVKTSDIDDLELYAPFNADDWHYTIYTWLQKNCDVKEPEKPAEKPENEEISELKDLMNT